MMNNATQSQAQVIYIDVDEDGPYIEVHPASPESVGLVLNADPDSDDGRSDWVWVRFPNGDLVLGVYPKGDTYFAVENDAAYPEN